jgi:hypothetical protein
MTRSNYRPKLERVIGQPETFRLSLRGTYHDLRRTDVLTLAQELTRVLANLARDEAIGSDHAEQSSKETD